MSVGLPDDFDPAHLEAATEAELDEILQGLRIARVASQEWQLQPRQQRAEDLIGQADREAAFELLYGGAAGGGKGLALDTMMLTGEGRWKRLGDLALGDEVFAPDGSPTRVLAISDTTGRPCYRVTFDDGASVIADDVHRWTVWTNADRQARARQTDAARAQRRAARPRRGTGARPDLAARNAAAATSGAPPTGRVVDTAALIDLIATEKRAVAIRMHAPPETPTRDLPLDPYLYGCWLGDGHTHNARITSADPEILEAFAATFGPLTRYDEYTYGIKGLRKILREMFVLGSKRVRPVYLLAPPKDRLAFLQGLMDTDGHACESGSVEFTSTDIMLARAVVSLAHSLGWKARMTTGRATLDGRDCGPKYRVKWTPDEIVFRLERKAARQRLGGERTRWRYIKSIEPVESRPTRCIAVDHPSHCFLAGSALIVTHNTDFLLWHLWQLSIRYPGVRSLYLRRTFPELQRSAIARSWERYDRKLAKWNESRKEWRFTNGSVIEFGYLEQATDQYQYQSAEYSCICWDELTQWPSDGPYRYLMSRLRAPYEATAKGLVPHVVAATNPGNVGGGWVRKRFIDVGPAETVHNIIDPETGVRCKRVFVPARLSDNAFIDQEAYAANLSMLDPATRAALLDGSWDVVEGQYFTEFDREIHVVKPFTIPSWWTRIRGYDFGFANPAAMVWGAFDGDGGCWIYKEFYRKELTVGAQAAEIKRLSMIRDETGRDVVEPIDYSVADPSIWTRTGAGVPIAQQFSDAGIIFRRALNARVDGWLRVREFLTPNMMTGEPRLHIFDTCTELIRTLPMLVRDVKNPEDLNCFVAGTVVATPSGPRAVESLQVGDLVDTPIGPRPIIKAGVSGIGPVWSVPLTNGERLTGTPDHCVVTLNRGLVPLCQLSEDDVLCDKIMGWLSSESPTRGSSTRDTKAGRTTTRTARFSRRGIRRFTSRSTSTITARSRRATTFTTSTTTMTTTRRTTSSPFQRRNTPGITSRNGGPTRPNAPASTNGTVPNQAGRCCETTHGKCESARQRERTRARIVDELVSRHRLVHAGSVPRSAGTDGNAPTRTCEPARSAAQSSAGNRTTPNPPSPVRTSAAGNYVGVDRVYHLTVGEVGLYYANGVLVTNTDGEDHLADALRYLMMSRPRAAKQRQPGPSTLEERITEKHRRKHKAGRGGMIDHPVVGWT